MSRNNLKVLEWRRGWCGGPQVGCIPIKGMEEDDDCLCSMKGNFNYALHFTLAQNAMRRKMHLTKNEKEWDGFTQSLFESGGNVIYMLEYIIFCNRCYCNM